MQLGLGREGKARWMDGSLMASFKCRKLSRPAPASAFNLASGFFLRIERLCTHLPPPSGWRFPNVREEKRWTPLAPHPHPPSGPKRESPPFFPDPGHRAQPLENPRAVGRGWGRGWGGGRGAKQAIRASEEISSRKCPGLDKYESEGLRRRNILAIQRTLSMHAPSSFFCLLVFNQANHNNMFSSLVYCPLYLMIGLARSINEVLLLFHDPKAY